MEISASEFNSPVGLLAFDYFNQGLRTIFNHLWAWIAVITAALSFWRIVFVASSSPIACIDTASNSPSSFIKESQAAAADSEDSFTAEIQRLLFLSASYSVLETENSTKGKFTVYYEEDGFGKIDDGGQDEGCDGGDSMAAECEELGLYCDDWELAMALRMGDLGWYRWQDLGVLDGSVVRLWDARRRRCALPLAVAGFG